MTRSQPAGDGTDASEVAQGVPGHGGELEAPQDALTVFPRHPEAPDTYYINGAWAPACITATDKRFTEAELAAEIWHSIVRFHGQNAGPEAAEEARRNMIFEHFANRPHFDHDEENQ